MYRGIVLGNEPRQSLTAERLQWLGAQVNGEGVQDFLLLPMGCDTPPEELKQLRKGGICFGIRPGQEVLNRCTELGLRVVDLNRELAFKRRNAIATAEAALALAVGNTPDTLFDSQVLVVGYGAIGSRLCRLLTALGTRVTGSARKAEELVQIVIEGCRAVHTESLAETVRPYAVVFNTVPAPVLTKEFLEKLPEKTLVLDLASGSGGLADVRPENYIQALALPGKTAPLAAARSAADTVWDLLEVNHAAE